MAIRHASRSDAKHLMRLVRESGSLDLNSCYAYLLLCEHFSETCLVAEVDGVVVGFVTAYRPPAKPDVVFAWQIGVAPSARNRGVAKRLLRHLLQTPACRDTKYLEATITEENRASQRLFRSLAEEMGVDMRAESGFQAEDFGDDRHEPEILYRIGPLAADRHHAIWED